MSEDQGAGARVVATMQFVRVVCVVPTRASASRVLGASSGHPGVAVIVLHLSAAPISDDLASRLTLQR